MEGVAGLGEVPCPDEGIVKMLDLTAAPKLANVKMGITCCARAASCKRVYLDSFKPDRAN